jgi:recombinational DNA repair protein (RecF pathway)
MYQKYTTEGFLVASHTRGEADKVFLLLTREFGMMHAHATSVRSSKSKLRSHMVSGALLTLTFLKSKTRWRLLEVSKSKEITPRSEEYKSFARILSVLKSLMHGEEKNESLFGAVMEFHEFLQSTGGNLSEAECLMMIKILHALGYGEPKGEEDLTSSAFKHDVFEKIKAKKSLLISQINKSLQATGL